MTTTDILGLLGFIAANFIVALSGALFRPGQWYEGLAKPVWRPPNWLFGPAWAILYITIAVAGWMIWRKVGFAGAGFALAIYGLQLVLNACWSAIFFGLRRMDLAFGEILFLWLSILATILVFYPIDANAALLLVPYLCWVTFASVLNFTIWRMNVAPAGQPVRR